MHKEKRFCNATGTRTFDYTSTGNLLSENLPGTFYGPGVSLHPAYDAKSRYAGYSLLVNSAVAQSAVLSFDAAGRPASVAAGTDTFAYGYVPGTDLPHTTSGPANMLRTLAYEPLRNVVASVENTVGGATVSRFGYTHDQVYRRTHTVFSGSAFATAAFARYTHNDRAELTAADKFLGTDTADETSPVPAYAYAYDFDPIGNRLTASDAETGTTVSKTYTPDQLNQYTAIVQPGTPPVTVSPQHDADGNQTTLDNAAGNWTLLWNAENRLVEMTRTDLRIQFLYDYRGRRVEKRTFVRHAGVWAVSSVRRFLYEGWTLVAEFTLDGASPVLDRTHLWGIDLSGSLEGAGGIGGLLRTRLHSPTGSAYYYPTYDASGNVSEYLAAAGTVAAHYEYAPFGKTVAATGPLADAFAFRFSTKYLDAETGLLYYGYRHLDPETGRWLSRDPIGEQGGTNLHAFVVNGPLGHIDALGLSGQEVLARAHQEIELLYEGLANTHDEYSRMQLQSALEQKESEFTRLAQRYNSAEPSAIRVSNQERLITTWQSFAQMQSTVDGYLMPRGTVPEGLTADSHIGRLPPGIEDPEDVRNYVVGEASRGLTSLFMSYIAASGAHRGQSNSNALIPKITNWLRSWRQKGCPTGKGPTSVGRFKLNERVVGQLDDPRLGKLAGQMDEARLNQLVESPDAQRFFDANTGNINIIQEVNGVHLRITTAADKFEIISVGPIRARNVTNSVSSGRFVPIGGGGKP